MKKLLTHIKGIIALLLIFSACAEIDNTVDSSFKQLKTETKWKCDGNGNKLYKIYDKYYDETGKLTRIIEYANTGITLSVKEIDYSGSVGLERTSYFDKNGKVDSTIVNENHYDALGKIAQKISFDSKGDTSSVFAYKYDVSGKLLSSNCANYSKAGLTFIEVKYLYNDSGSLKERIQCDVTTGLQKKDSLIYKLDNKTIEKIAIDSNGGVENIYTYIYNNNGLIYKELESSPSGKIINLFVYDYMYY